MSNGHAVRRITFAPDPNHSITPWTPPYRRVGRPRFKWVTETIKNMWHNIRHEYTHLPQVFDEDDVSQHEAITHAIGHLASDLL